MTDERSIEPPEPEPERPEPPGESRPRRSLVAARESFFGPLPHPDHYERYAAVIPDGADRLMAMAEREQRHRHLTERWAMAAAFALAVIFLTIGTALILAGHDWAGAAIVVSTIGALAGAFITGRSDFGRD